jgi:hypothetical protein
MIFVHQRDAIPYRPSCLDFFVSQSNSGMLPKNWSISYEIPGA